MRHGRTVLKKKNVGIIGGPEPVSLPSQTTDEYDRGAEERKLFWDTFREYGYGRL